MITLDPPNDETERRQKGLYLALMTRQLSPKFYAVLWLTWTLQSESWRWN